MIHTQTILVPSLFDETTAPLINDEKVSDMARAAKQKLEEELAKGWRITHSNSFIYAKVAYMHYVLEYDDEVL